MEKEIKVDNHIFKFTYREDGNFWYLGKSSFDMFNLGYSSDITINEKSPDWSAIEGFLGFIMGDIKKMKDKIDLSNIKLKQYFEDLYKAVVRDLDFNGIFFTLSNIDYQGTEIGDRMRFKYVLNFNVESKSDNTFFMYESWNVNLIDDEILDVSKS